MTFGVSGPKNPVSTKIFRTTNLTTTSGASTTPSYDTVFWSYRGMLQGTGSWDRIYAPVRGIYLAEAAGWWVANATGFRQLTIQRILLNGGISPRRIQRNIPDGTNNISNDLTAVVLMNAGESMRGAYLQNSGGNLNLLTGSFYTPILSLTLLSEL